MCVSVSPRDYPQNAHWIIQPSLKHVDSTANIYELNHRNGSVFLNNSQSS